MGNGRWDPTAWTAYSSTTRGHTVAHNFTSRSLKDEFNPAKFGLRESRDSEDNPAATPLIFALDVTGSMGMIPNALIGDGLGTLCKEILDRKPVSDPHIMMMAVGDAIYDDAPLQMTQFEADLRIADQMKTLWIEGGGGGNGFESYNLPWYAAAMKTSVDAYEKRGRKGFLFTIGDEEVPDPLTADQIEKVFGVRPQVDRFDNAQLLTMAGAMYNIFHIVVEQGSHCRHGGADKVVAGWRELLGQRVIRLADYEKLPEVIVSTIQVVEGADKATVTGSWSGDTSLVVARAIDGLPVSAGGTGGGTGLVRF